MSDGEGSDSEMYSITSSQTIYKRSKSRTTIHDRDREPLPRILVGSDSDERASGRASETSYASYVPVTKYAVDYNNKNYVRSQCNKNKGLHRKVKGRPENWHIEYDNNYFTHSKVNKPKGLHRKIPDVKRKYAPDKDDLADANGWEFECGPEFEQKEQDVCFIPEGRIIARGCYRWYGVKRNDSDCDIKQEEHRENVLTEKLKNQLKAGQEFHQSDIPHLRMDSAKDRRYSEGGYRWYETLRNAHDVQAEELDNAEHDPEWRRKHHTNGVRYLDLDTSKYDSEERHKRKGKPFRRTILNKVHEIKKVEDRRSPKRRGTRLSLVPGEGDKTFYEGVRDSDRASSTRSVFRKKSEIKRYTHGDEYEEYRTEDEERKYSSTLRPDYEDDRRRGQRRRQPYEDEDSGQRLYKGYAAYDAQPVVEEDDYEEYGKKGTNNRRDSRVGTSHEDRRRGSPAQDRRRTVGTVYDEDRSVRSLKREARRSSADAGYDERRRERRVRTPEDRHRRDRLRAGYDEHGSVRSAEEQNRKNTLRQRRNKERMHPRDEFGETMPDKGRDSKKLPPDVEKRIEDIRGKMEKQIKVTNKKHPDERDGPIHSGSDEDIDLMKHKHHPKDRGEYHNSGYEKYITKNGSEVWVKKEETITELHHKNHR